MTAPTFERRRMRVYVAGPISKGDVLQNVVNAMKVGRRMVHDGLAPFIPHLDAFMFAWGDPAENTEALSWNEYLEWDLEWVAQSEAVFRLPGESKGADLEVKHAQALGIPVFEVYESVLVYAELCELKGPRRVEAQKEAAEKEPQKGA